MFLMFHQEFQILQHYEVSTIKYEITLKSLGAPAEMTFCNIQFSYIKKKA